MFGLLDALLGAGDGDDLAVVGDGGHADLSRRGALQLLQLLPQAPEDPAVVLLGDSYLLARLPTRQCDSWRFSRNIFSLLK